MGRFVRPVPMRCRAPADHLRPRTLRRAAESTVAEILIVFAFLFEVTAIVVVLLSILDPRR